MGLDALIERKRQDFTEKSLKIVATATRATRATPALKVAKVAKVARVNPQTDHILEPTTGEKLHELDMLIRYIAEREDFSEESEAEAKFLARKDVELALTSFRALARNIRRDKAMELLQDSPESLRAIHIDSDSDPENIIITTALRHVSIFEMIVQRCKWDSFKMINILNGLVH